MIFDQKFVQGLILLLLTAILTGLVVPYILRVVDTRKAREQKDREAELARQAKVVEAQAKFLDDLSNYLWRWRYLCIRLAYQGGRSDAERYADAEGEYEKSIFEVFCLVRNEISRSRRLVSESAYHRLLDLYEKDLVPLDNRISDIRDKDPGILRAAEFRRLNEDIYHTVSTRIDGMLNELANELQLRGGTP
jgi:hypothetical protein